MSDLLNCPECGGLFVKNMFKDTCDKCYREEEKMFEEVYGFLRKRENRAASIERVVEVTGVKEKLIHKWVRKRRLQPTHFPNMGYPCDNCGKIISKSKLCETCSDGIKQDLKTFSAQEEWREKQKQNQQATYLSGNARNNK
ncbi:TIGR03826 family flagellar region protein [Bacillus sp. AK031]